MVNDPDHLVRSELDIAQVRWALVHHSPEGLFAECKATLDDAATAWTGMTEPTRQQQGLKSQLDKMRRIVLDSRSKGDEEAEQIR